MSVATTLPELKQLEQLYGAGFQDPFLDNALRKILSRQTARDGTDLDRVSAVLAEFEQQYGMDSEQFWRRYQAGELGDEADWVEWNAFCKMKDRLQRRLQILQGDKA